MSRLYHQKPQEQRRETQTKRSCDITDSSCSTSFICPDYRRHECLPRRDVHISHTEPKYHHSYGHRPCRHQGYHHNGQARRYVCNEHGSHGPIPFNHTAGDDPSDRPHNTANHKYRSYRRFLYSPLFRKPVTDETVHNEPARKCIESKQRTKRHEDPTRLPLFYSEVALILFVVVAVRRQFHVRGELVVEDEFGQAPERVRAQDEPVGLYRRHPDVLREGDRVASKQRPEGVGREPHQVIPAEHLSNLALVIPIMLLAQVAQGGLFHRQKRPNLGPRHRYHTDYARQTQQDVVLTDGKHRSSEQLQEGADSQRVPPTNAIREHSQHHCDDEIADHYE